MNYFGSDYSIRNNFYVLSSVICITFNLLKIWIHSGLSNHYQYYSIIYYVSQMLCKNNYRSELCSMFIRFLYRMLELVLLFCVPNCNTTPTQTTLMQHHTNNSHATPYKQLSCNTIQTTLMQHHTDNFHTTLYKQLSCNTIQTTFIQHHTNNSHATPYKQLSRNTIQNKQMHMLLTNQHQQD